MSINTSHFASDFYGNLVDFIILRDSIFHPDKEYKKMTNWDVTPPLGQISQVDQICFEVEFEWEGREGRYRQTVNYVYDISRVDKSVFEYLMYMDCKMLMKNPEARAKFRIWRKTESGLPYLEDIIGKVASIVHGGGKSSVCVVSRPMMTARVYHHIEISSINEIIFGD
jgi:hypothetical protein